MEKSCGIILFNLDEVLLLQYSFNNKNDHSGHWEFPKGHVEIGESELETALRELHEETGIKEVSIVKGFRHAIYYDIRENSKIISKEVIFFIAQSKTQEVILSSEHQDYEWLSKDDAFSKLTYNNAREALQKAFIFMKKSDV